jgi:adenosylcobinamide-phosphate synthase
VESVAENLTDSVLAPACFYLAFGLPGAAVYRVINTADAMIGYRDGVLEHFGKVAARLDDLLNLVPARLAALVLVTAALTPGFDARAAWSVLRRDRRRTASPNAGWTMSAMAGALGVTLEKRETYRLGDGPLPARGHIPRAVDLFTRATALGVALLLLVRALVG